MVYIFLYFFSKRRNFRYCHKIYRLYTKVTKIDIDITPTKLYLIFVEITKVSSLQPVIPLQNPIAV